MKCVASRYWVRITTVLRCLRRTVIGVASGALWGVVFLAPVVLSGFAPLQLPPELDFAALFHGVDERVPVDALKFGTQVFEHFLMNS